MLKILPVVAPPNTFKFYTPAFSSKSMMVELKSPLSNSEDGDVAHCLYRHSSIYAVDVGTPKKTAEAKTA